jgi:hypothetical protein
MGDPFSASSRIGARRQDEELGVSAAGAPNDNGDPKAAVVVVN